MQTYIDAKDEFDYKNNNYTTTENVDTTIHEGVRSIQRKLNEKGYTDKFGNKLKEDGIYGGKTAYALDEFEKNNINKIQSNIKSNKSENFSINNISEEDWLKIANALGYTNEDLNVAALAYNDKGELMVPSSYVSAYGIGEPVYQSVDSILGNDNMKVATKSVNYNLANKEATFNAVTNGFDYDTRLSFSTKYNENVKILQNRLVELGYLDMSSGAWGYYGPKTLAAVNKYKKDNNLGNIGKDAGVVGKDTWTSLGLIYRTQKDIDAGVKIVTVGTEQYFDITEAVTSALSKAEPEFQNHKFDTEWFAQQVGNSGPWNIKQSAEVWANTLNISENSYNSGKLIFHGNFYVIDDIGNITYGYLGKVAGFPDAVLYLGSLKNHFDTHGDTNMKNEYNDHERIRTGIRLYKGIDISAKISY